MEFTKLNKCLKSEFNISELRIAVTIFTLQMDSIEWNDANRTYGLDLAIRCNLSSERTPIPLLSHHDSENRIENLESFTKFKKSYDVKHLIKVASPQYKAITM
jgi:hypothetical protein